MSKKSNNKKYEITHTNYGDYIKNEEYYAFLEENRAWRNNDPIGFELEVINRFAYPPEK